MRTRDLILNKALKLPEYLLTKEHPDTLVFLHLPKTGGTTLLDIVHNNYNPWRSVFFPVPGRRDKNGQPASFEGADHIEAYLFGKTISPGQKVDCITGHLPYGIHRFLPKPCHYIAIVRDPIKLVWSKFNHLINRKQHYLYPYLEKHDFNLAKLLRSNEVFEFCNEQSRTLLGTRKWTLEDSDIPKVIEHVDQNIALIGTMRTFDQALLEMQKRFAWKTITYTPKNVGNYKKISAKPDEDAIAAIRETSKVDIALYEHVVGKS